MNDFVDCETLKDELQVLSKNIYDDQERARLKAALLYTTKTGYLGNTETVKDCLDKRVFNRKDWPKKHLNAALGLIDLFNKLIED